MGSSASSHLNYRPDHLNLNQQEQALEWVDEMLWADDYRYHRITLPSAYRFQATLRAENGDTIVHSWTTERLRLPGNLLDFYRFTVKPFLMTKLALPKKRHRGLDGYRLESMKIDAQCNPTVSAAAGGVILGA